MENSDVRHIHDTYRKPPSNPLDDSARVMIDRRYAIRRRGLWLRVYNHKKINESEIKVIPAKSQAVIKARKPSTAGHLYAKKKKKKESGEAREIYGVQFDISGQFAIHKQDIWFIL